MKVLVPENLNLDKIISKKGNALVKHIRKPKKDFLYFLISTIYELSSLQDSRYQNGMVPLYSKILQKHDYYYNQYVDYLINNKIIKVSAEADYRWGKCNRYGLTKQYKNIGLVPVEIDNKYRRYIKLNFITDLDLQKLINDELEQTIKVDVNNTYKKQNEWLENIHFDDNAFHKHLEKMDDISEKNRALIQMNKIHELSNGGIEEITTRDSTSFRFHSPLTRLNKDFRKYLRYNGQILGQVDIKNSQPFFLTALLNKEFWELDNPTLKRFLVDKIKISDGHGLLSRSEVTKCLNSINDIEKQKYINAVRTGTFYDIILERMNQNVGKGKIFHSPTVRDHAKELFMFTAYSNNKQNYFVIRKTEANSRHKIGDKIKIPKGIIAQEFPTIYNLMKVVKKHYHKRLPIILQHIESHCVLDLVYERLAIEHPDIPCFTIHDSIVSLPDYLDLIEKIATEEIKNFIGLKPTLSKEIWQ